MPTLAEKLERLKTYGPYVLQCDERLTKPVQLGVARAAITLQGQTEEEVIDAALEMLETRDGRQVEMPLLSEVHSD